MSKKIIDDNEFIGKKFSSNSCNDFTVIRKTNNKSYRNTGNFLYEIEFDEINGVKYKKQVRKEYILKGKILNPYYPTVHGVGYLGNANHKNNMYIYRKWSKMISRCYNEKDKKYKNYGAIGVFVCDRWKCFEFFLNDFPFIEGYKKDEKQSLDKDIKAKSEPKYYSLETCYLISVIQNTKEMQCRISPYFKAISPIGKEYISNCQMDFVRNYNLDKSCINDVLKGRQKQHKGWKFEYLKGDEYD